jgi:hypothetical protein
MNVKLNGKACSVLPDVDSDGYVVADDCNDNNANIHPNGVEKCNLIDDDCDNQVDDGVKTTFYADVDLDGFGDPNATFLACAMPAGYLANDDDCNDNPGTGGASMHPNGIEICNLADDDCDGLTDEQVLVYEFTDKTTGKSNFISPLLTSTNIAPVNGAVSASQSCATGFSSKNYPNSTSFSSTLPAIEFTITPVALYQLNGEFISVELRRSSTGPASFRFAYSADNGLTWLDEGVDHTFESSPCGVMNSFSWDIPDFGTKKTFRFRIYGFNASATSGILQALNIKLNGQVCVAIVDDDEDGYSVSVDCNDHNASIYPGAPESCNSIDDNCNNFIDENSQTIFYADADQDGFGNPNVTTGACPPPPGYLTNHEDCNDNNALVHPNVTDICNSVDDDCDGITDEPMLVYSFTNNISGIPASVSPNATGSNLTSVNGAALATQSCTTGYNAKKFSNGTVFSTTLTAVEFTMTPASNYHLEAASFSADVRRSSPGPALIRYAYSIDGGTNWITQNADQALAVSGCELTTTYSWDFPDFVSAQPVKFRIYGFNSSSSTGILQLINVKLNGNVCNSLADMDGDSFLALVDCDDGNPFIYPNAVEVCNYLDDDCDGSIDEGVNAIYYADADSDHFGNPNAMIFACSLLPGYAANNQDCNDTYAFVNPLGTEVCNGLDDNCNSVTDEGVQTTFYADTDNDSFGNPNVTTLACSVPSGYSPLNTDCNDANAGISPNASETCNNKDDNCNGQVDDGVQTTFYADGDGDGFGNPSVTAFACNQPLGYVTNNADCNDSEPTINPSALPIKQWDFRYGGNILDELYVMRQTNDGGYILGGRSYSGAGDDKSQTNWDASKATSDFWVIKISAIGIKQWDKRFGGTADDVLTDLQQTTDGSFILGGYSYSGISGDKSQDSRGLEDYWIIKINSFGVKVWDARFGGDQNDEMQSIQQTADGGYIIGGFSSSGIGGDRSQASQGDRDYWILKTDANGVKQWDKRFGGAGTDELYVLKQIADGYLLSGRSKSGLGGDKTQSNRDSLNLTFDYWVVKVDAVGTKRWDYRFGGPGEDNLLAMIQTTSDKGYLMGGYSRSAVGGDKTIPSRGGNDYWMVKTDSNGVKQWDACYGGSDEDHLYSLAQSPEGGYLAAGRSRSGISGDKTVSNWDPSNQTYDYWLLKITNSGALSWNTRYGGTANDGATSLQSTQDGGIALAGYSYSGISGDKTQKNRDTSLATPDYWMLKVGVNGGLQTFYADPDADGYGNPLQPLSGCTSPPGYVANNADCNSESGAVRPGVADICNNIDDNCNSIIDDNALVATITPSGATTTCKGVDLVLMANTGAGIAYQWLKDNVAVAGATNATYATSKKGTFIVMESNSFLCSSTSLATTVTVALDPSASITPLGNLDICATGSVMLQANSGEGLTYQWKKGNKEVSGATAITYTAVKAATYKVIVTNSSNCSKTSAGVKVTQSCKEAGSQEEDIMAGLSIYPNPTDGTFVLNLRIADDAPEQEAIIHVLNAFGQIVLDRKAKVVNGKLIEEINPGNALSNGTYLVKVMAGNGVYMSSIVIQR